MTKRGKLIGSIVCLLFIAIMIPVTVFALTQRTITGKSYVKFNVVDFQGDFYIGLIGNTPAQDSSSTDIGTLANNTLTPTKLFTAKYDTATTDYQVYDVYNNPSNPTQVNNEIEFNTGIIEFNKDHYSIDYYFVFINTAVKNADNNNRDVYLTTTTESVNNLTTTWSYVTKDTNNATSSSFELPQTGWTTTTDNDIKGTIAQAKARESETSNYNYIVLRCNMSVNPNLQENIDAEFTITINIASMQ